MFVIARTSTFTYKGQAITVKQIGRELGVRYVLEGSVRRAGGRVRITAQLIEAETGVHLWADRFDGSLEDVFDLQDKVALSVAGVIEPALQAAETDRSVSRPTQDTTAYDLYLRALSSANSGEKNGYTGALSLLRQAIKRDPGYGPGLILAAFCHAALYLSGWAGDPETHQRDALALVQRGLRATKNDAETQARAAYVLGLSGGDLDVAIALVDRALELNPGCASGWRWSGWLRVWAGNPDVAIEHFQSALRLNPRDPSSATKMGIGVAHFFAHRFPEAKMMLLQDLQGRPGWVPTYRFLASCYAHLGQPNEAHETVNRLRTLTSVLVPSASHWRRPEDRELYLSGLRLAVDDRPWPQS